MEELTCQVKDLNQSWSSRFSFISAMFLSFSSGDGGSWVFRVDYDQPITVNSFEGWQVRIETMFITNSFQVCTAASVELCNHLVGWKDISASSLTLNQCTLTWLLNVQHLDALVLPTSGGRPLVWFTSRVLSIQPPLQTFQLHHGSGVFERTMSLNRWEERDDINTFSFLGQWRGLCQKSSIIHHLSSIHFARSSFLYKMLFLQ